jgi:hypothetical protein
MELAELIKTLEQRGMKKHPRLLRDGRYWVLDNPSGYLVDESDAADLLAMHAARWINGSGTGLIAALARAGDSNGLLKFIVANTTHLEPEPLRDVGKDPRVGDVIGHGPRARTVKAVTPELVAYMFSGIAGAADRAEWAALCSQGDPIITRVEYVK